MDRRLGIVLFSLLVPGIGAAAESGAPKLDPKRIINESSGFLHEREPEMSAEEYAIYQKVEAALASNPAFAVKMLEAMTAGNETPSPAFAFILGNAYYAAGDLPKAEASFRAAIKRYDTFLRAWSNLGILYYSSNRFADAIPCLSKAVSLGDRDPTTLGLLGYCLEQTGNVVAAEMAYLQALTVDPENANWSEGLLRIYIQGKQLGRAESLAKNLIQAHPQETRYWLTYANILLEDNRRLEAMTVLEVAATAGVAGKEELGLLADLYAEHKLVPEAIATYQKLLAVDPALGEQKLLRLAQSFIDSGQPARAAQVLDSLPRQLSPAGRLTALQTRADLLAAQGHWADARRKLEQLLSLAPLDGRALLGLGQAYAAESDLPRATFAFESARKVPEVAFQANLELANIEIKNRHYQKSADYLEAALKLQRSPAIEDYLYLVKGLAAKSTE